jgi:hypothetical protein
MAQEHSFGDRDRTSSMAFAGLTVGLLAAAGAGAYLFLGKDGVRNRKKLADWARDRLSAPEVNRDMVLAVIAGLVRRFTRFSRLSASELAEALGALESAWQTIERTHGRKQSKLATQR